MAEEHVATYIYDPRLDYGVYEIHAVYETSGDRNRRNVSWYNIYNKSGICINDNDPWYEMPTWQQVFDKHYMLAVN
jgi:hypothetical protein